MNVRREANPFLAVAVALGAAVAGACRWGGQSWISTGLLAGSVIVVLGGYFLCFFRDPPRSAPADPSLVVAGADGHVARITLLSREEVRRKTAAAGLTEEQVGCLLQTDAVRISIFLSLFDVHVNRAPIAGESRFLGYFPGKHVFTFLEKSSDHNQHNSILIRNDKTCCLFNQIVGPVCRRVVYWPPHDQPVQVDKGDPIGMMKFGSRLDLYFPADTVDVSVREGDEVRAGETVVASLRTKDRT
jgi:phosphatidylserine decarboxylase